MCVAYREHQKAINSGNGLDEGDRDEMNEAFYEQLAELVEERSRRDNMIVCDLQPVDADDSSETLGAEDSFSEEEDVGDEEGDEGDEGDVDEGGDDLDFAGDLDPDEGIVAQPGGASGERGRFVIKILKSRDSSDDLHTPDPDGEEVEAFLWERSVCDNTIREKSPDSAADSRGGADDPEDISDMDISDVPDGNLLSGEPGLEELIQESSGQQGGQEMSLMDLLMLPANKDSRPEGNE